MNKYTRNQIQDFFEYLDALRETGDTNMTAAGKHLEFEYSLDHKEAREVLKLWMSTYASDITAEGRAEMVAD